jgi:hypothetical protein
MEEEVTGFHVDGDVVVKGKVLAPFKGLKPVNRDLL